jgi:uncharacterized protein YggE
MKKIILVAALLFFVMAVYAQTPTTHPNPFPKTITVTGAAEMEVTPDEIYVNIELREYQKKGDNKKDIETLKSQFLGYCRDAGIADSNISIASYAGYSNYYLLRRNKKKPDMMASITYQVKFKSSAVMDQLIEKLDDEATQDFQIVSTRHSKMPEYRKQLKIMAVKAAKDKGVYLTEAINEKLGPAIDVDEPDENNNNNIVLPYRSQTISQARSNVMEEYGSTDLVNVNFKKIKLRYEVKIVFALQ